MFIFPEELEIQRGGPCQFLFLMALYKLYIFYSMY
jgi:hypothetical protein